MLAGMVGGFMGALDILADDCMHLTSELTAAGATKADLAKAAAENDAMELRRGVWISMDGFLAIERGMSAASACLLNPGAIVCLFSATNWHELCDDDPTHLWLALDARRRHAVGEVIARVGWSGPLLTVGIEEHVIAGVTVRVTDPARTVVDVLRHRHRYGNEQSVRALADYVRYGYDIGRIWDLAIQVGALKAVEPFVRAADEFKLSIPVTRRSGT